MDTVESLKAQIQALPDDELAQFRAWFLEFDWERWDAQLERDSQSGKLDALAERALHDRSRKSPR